MLVELEVKDKSADIEKVWRSEFCCFSNIGSALLMAPFRLIILERIGVCLSITQPHNKARARHQIKERNNCSINEPFHTLSHCIEISCFWIILTVDIPIGWDGDIKIPEMWSKHFSRTLLAKYTVYSTF